MRYLVVFMASFASFSPVSASPSLETPKARASSWRKKGLSVDVSFSHNKANAVAIADGEAFLENESIASALQAYLAHSCRSQAQEIGRGNFSTVYKLEPIDKDLQHLEVIKLLYKYEPFRSSRGEYLANQMDSPYFLKAECLFYQDGKIINEPVPGALEIGVILPYVSGMTLREGIEQRLIDENRALAIVKQIALALIDLKKAGIAHRDLKPENIMIQNDGSVILLDFGISRQYPSSGDETPVGTAAYMAPERDSGGALEGLGIEKSDVYSLGRIFLQLLGGKISGDFWERVGQPDVTETPERFHGVLKAMLQPNPADRASVDRVLDLLATEE